MYVKLINDLVNIFNNDAYLSIVVDNTIKTCNFQDHDNKLYTKIIYGVCEKKMLLDFYLNTFTKGKRIKPHLRNALRIGAYAIDFLNLANHYIVNELNTAMKKIDFHAVGMLNAVLRSYVEGHDKTEDIKNKNLRASTELSIPLPLYELLNKQYPKKLNKFFGSYEGLNTYRINTIKTTPEDVSKILNNDNISYSIKKEALFTKSSLINHSLFQDGLIIAQDASSINVGWVANPEHNMNILDVCCAPGGKALHIASMMNNTGHILCGDMSSTKIDKILANAKKLGITNIEAAVMDGTSFDYNQTFDMIILDAPCSGLGVINHKPDLKYRMTIEKIEEINELQYKIINHVKNYLKPTGILVYSTCTINKDENENLIRNFIKENAFSIIEEHIINPSKQSDGFYICKLRKE